MVKKRHNNFCLRGAALTLGGVLLIAAMRGCFLQRDTTPPCSPPTLRVYLHREDRVVSMDAEEYLVGVLGGEMPASFPLEALKAQAVAARTYTLRRMEGFGYDGCGKGYDLCTDSGCCQAYKTPQELEEIFGSSTKEYTDKLREAVRSTAGEAALYNGEPIEALYHSSAGGHTEDAQNVFSSRVPYLVGVSSPGEEDSSKYRDSVHLSQREFAAAVNQSFPEAELRAGRLSSQTEILSRYESGRVEELRLGGTTLSGREFRKLFDLNSANFQIAFSEEGVEISTTGFGHGVGMSQYGARAMALEGADYREILEHYYTGVEIGKVW